MRVRLFVLLVALVAIVAVPSEATLSPQTGSVVDQVTSCLEPNGLVRELDARSDSTASCRDDQPLGRVGAVLAMLAAAVLLVGAVPGPGSRDRRSTRARWRLSEAVSRSGAPWRAPPRLV